MQNRKFDTSVTKSILLHNAGDYWNWDWSVDKTMVSNPKYPFEYGSFSIALAHTVEGMGGVEWVEFMMNECGKPLPEEVSQNLRTIKTNNGVQIINRLRAKFPEYYTKVILQLYLILDQYVDEAIKYRQTHPRQYMKPLTTEEKEKLKTSSK
jgi:hypothetical protein